MSLSVGSTQGDGQPNSGATGSILTSLPAGATGKPGAQQGFGLSPIHATVDLNTSAESTKPIGSGLLQYREQRKTGEPPPKRIDSPPLAKVGGGMPDLHDPSRDLNWSGRSSKSEGSVLSSASHPSVQEQAGFQLSPIHAKMELTASGHFKSVKKPQVSGLVQTHEAEGISLSPLHGKDPQGKAARGSKDTKDGVTSKKMESDVVLSPIHATQPRALLEKGSAGTEQRSPKHVLGRSHMTGTGHSLVVSKTTADDQVHKSAVPESLRYLVREERGEALKWKRGSGGSVGGSRGIANVAEKAREMKQVALEKTPTRVSDLNASMFQTLGLEGDMAELQRALEAAGLPQLPDAGEEAGERHEEEEEEEESKKIEVASPPGREKQLTSPAGDYTHLSGLSIQDAIRALATEELASVTKEILLGKNAAHESTGKTPKTTLAPVPSTPALEPVRIMDSQLPEHSKFTRQEPIQSQGGGSGEKKLAVEQRGFELSPIHEIKEPEELQMARKKASSSKLEGRDRVSKEQARKEGRSDTRHTQTPRVATEKERSNPPTVISNSASLRELSTPTFSSRQRSIVGGGGGKRATSIPSQVSSKPASTPGQIRPPAPGQIRPPPPGQTRPPPPRHSGGQIRPPAPTNKRVHTVGSSTSRTAKARRVPSQSRKVSAAVPTLKGHGTTMRSTTSASSGGLKSDMVVLPTAGVDKSGDEESIDMVLAGLSLAKVCVCVRAPVCLSVCAYLCICM